MRLGSAVPQPHEALVREKGTRARRRTRPSIFSPPRNSHKTRSANGYAYCAHSILPYLPLSTFRVAPGDLHTLRLALVELFSPGIKGFTDSVDHSRTVIASAPRSPGEPATGGAATSDGWGRRGKMVSKHSCGLGSAKIRWHFKCWHLPYAGRALR
jgi:hypothetical protein